MDKENYIFLKAEDVHRQLITDIPSSLDEASELLDELTEIDRYKEDHLFRASVETSKVYILTLLGRASEVVKRCSQLIDVAEILKEWEILSFDYNMIANAYFMLGLYEKALEYYYCAINNEKEHGLKNTLPVSYANIGLIFLNIGIYEKAVENLRSALKYIEYADKDYFKYREKKIQILSDMMTAMTKMDSPDAEEIERIFEQMCCFNIEGLDENTLYPYYLGLMGYCFWKEDFTGAKEKYLEARAVTRDNDINKLAVLYSFIEECDNNNMDLKFFEEELLEVEACEKSDNPIDDPSVFINLRKYYMSKGNNEKVEEVELSYRDFLEDNLRMSREKQADSLQIIENVLKGRNETNTEDDKNKEFKLVAEEAIRNKDELQKTYNRIKMIHEIGLKLTSSTDLNEVVSLIYKNIRENIPADAFMFLAAEPENNQLRSLLSYNMGSMDQGFTVSYSNEESALVRCCLNNKIVSTEDDDFVPVFGRYVDEDNHDEEGMKSALFIPLSIGDKVIGAYSVQSRHEKSYSQDTLLFLRELRPYLVIALNNAIHSQKLQNEIIKNKETQAKLKKANDMLSKIAGLDALTQISNRREFTEKFHELRKRAAELSQTISVFMFDIDDFKKYNDTYGHFEGDEALKKAARIINSNIIARGGIAARFGGEEFISACIGLTANENFELGDKIRTEIFSLGIENIDTKLGILSISVGIAIAKPGVIITKSEIMSLADEMLYEAKKTGKNKVVIRTFNNEKDEA